MNLPPGSMSSWDEMRDRFVANFQGTHDRPPAAGDLCRVKQQPGETLQKYMHHFNNVRLKIPKVTDEAIISVFSDGVCDVKMKEELAIHEELCTSLELFNLRTAQELKRGASPSLSSRLRTRRRRKPRPRT